MSAETKQAPARLWVDTFGMEPGRPKWGYWDEPTESTTEYVRADIADDIRDALRDALDFIDAPDAPAVGDVVQDSLVSRAYVNLATLLDSHRAAITKATRGEG